MIPADLTLSGGVTHPRRNKTQGTSTATSRSVSRPLHPRSRRAPRRRPRSFLPVWPPSHRMVGVETGILPPELLNLIVHRFHKSDKRQYFFSCFFFLDLFWIWICYRRTCFQAAGWDLSVFAGVVTIFHPSSQRRSVRYNHNHHDHREHHNHCEYHNHYHHHNFNWRWMEWRYPLAIKHSSEKSSIL